MTRLYFMLFLLIVVVIFVLMYMCYFTTCRKKWNKLLSILSSKILVASHLWRWEGAFQGALILSMLQQLPKAIPDELLHLQGGKMQ